MKFSYKAVRASGEELTGTAEAVDRFALAREMRVQGLTLVSAKPLAALSSGRGVSWLAFLRLTRHLGIKQQVVLAGSLGAMIAAGLSLARSLEVVDRQAGRGRLHEVLVEIADSINRGNSLSQALAAFPRDFPPVFAAMAAAGEESGKLSESLEMIRTQLANSYNLRRKVRGAMMYPGVIIAAMIVVGILMMIFVVPSITKLFQELKVDLPLTTRLLIYTSNLFSGHPWSLLSGSAFSLLAIIRLGRTRRGRRLFVYLVMRLPLIKTVVHNFNAAATMRTLASLVAAGVPMIQALTITKEVVQNPYYQEVLDDAASRVQKGVALSNVFSERTDIYPVLVGELMAVGEETGNISGMLGRGAVFFEEEVEQTTKNISTLIEPGLMIVIGIAVAFFAVSIIGPIYKLTEAL